ncbi:Hydrolase (HAD superfamily) [Mycoplasmopsis meleagridis]|uniref:Hydrolase (HAD superfamily) n=1 Tax=Mycoplasmopsis meleagridis ATCC 25294 TaxID=1264554 RepID=A0A0F5H0B4_9BACT|nr:Cof-type HAD-IIB family hydrolase [Mycoplasmopsis meleagridis]KKB26643.1 Hydrolase (HAD superfamily) [Mycoplasmopsis meleagridis ATCC 25294]KUH47653.1 hydrolase [Mycoplasmopsis meleagridis]OAD18242.1 Hydrolase (HAD superfamily) [Mycoplasmopsis meleagridis]VEU77697.1 COF family HAD hydrolase protein [Mycoplasmopsis meleagridis]
MTNNKFLFAIDLDGTLLASSKTGEIHEKSFQAILRAKNEGHIVCLLTGRPWRSTKPIYDKLGLDTVVANYNGAQIHNPKDENFIPYIKYLDLNEMLYVLGDPKVKNETTNIAIEGPGWVQIQHRDPALESVFGFRESPKFVVGLNFNKLPLKPTGIIFDVKETTDVEELRSYLKRKYGDLGEFSYWSKGKGLTPVFDITNVSTSKGRALSLLSRYYGIDLENTIAFGDGFNDVPMFKVAKISVAVGNASAEVKKYASVKLKLENDEGAVGDFINKLLDNPEKVIQKSNLSLEKMMKQRKNYAEDEE